MAKPDSAKFTFIDLFAGIGGTRIAFEEAGGRCVFSSEIDKFARQTYAANHGEEPAGDITQIDACDIPDHDVLVAGFPCQPFSISGVSKKNALGRPHGFDDPTQGTMFFEICRILEEKQPRAFLLENVKNLRSHDRGNTFRTIKERLNGLGYGPVHDTVADADAFVPQHRERTYLVGFKPFEMFEWPSFEKSEKPKFREILDPGVDPKYTLSDHLWEYLQNYARKHREKGNGFGFGLTDLDGRSRTLSARYYKDGSEVLVPQEGMNPRRLTPRECARLMGFLDFRPDFEIPVSDTQAYKQFGNSVVVPVVHQIAVAISDVLTSRTSKLAVA